MHGTSGTSTCAVGWPALLSICGARWCTWLIAALWRTVAVVATRRTVPRLVVAVRQQMAVTGLRCRTPREALLVGMWSHLRAFATPQLLVLAYTCLYLLVANLRHRHCRGYGLLYTCVCVCVCACVWWCDRYPISITTSQELLELLASIGSPNRVTHLPGMSAPAVACWGMIQLQLKTLGVPDLRHMFADMHPHHRQTGLDDALSGCEWFATHRMALGEAALADGYVPLLQQFAKRGVPPTLRRAVWAAVLGVGGGGASGQRSATARRRGSGRGPEVSDVPGWVGMPPSAVAPLTAKERALVESLLRDWREVSFVTDAIVAEDVRQTCNDEW